MQLHLNKLYYVDVLVFVVGKIAFSGFIPTMKFVEKQHYLTLETLILFKLKTARKNINKKYRRICTSDFKNYIIRTL